MEIMIKNTKAVCQFKWERGVDTQNGLRPSFDKLNSIGHYLIGLLLTGPSIM